MDPLIRDIYIGALSPYVKTEWDTLDLWSVRSALRKLNQQQLWPNLIKVIKDHKYPV